MTILYVTFGVVFVMLIHANIQAARALKVSYRRAKITTQLFDIINYIRHS